MLTPVRVCTSQRPPALMSEPFGTLDPRDIDSAGANKENTETKQNKKCRAYTIATSALVTALGSSSSRVARRSPGLRAAPSERCHRTTPDSRTHRGMYIFITSTSQYACCVCCCVSHVVRFFFDVVQRTRPEQRGGGGVRRGERARVCVGICLCCLAVTAYK